jgi:TonB family protein
MNDAAANPPTLEPARPPREGWSALRWFAVILLAFAAHAGFILTFGENKPVVRRAVTDVPRLRLANAADELPALNNPTLFALPQQHDFAVAGCLNMPEVKSASFRWTEPPRWLPLSGEGLGVAYGEFLHTNFFAGHLLDFKPAPELSAPELPIQTAIAQNSTMRVEGDLAQRQLPSEISLTNWPYADVLQPCVVQVLVDAAGNVVSTVILTSSGYDPADQRALELARTLNFKPASRLAVGRVTFNWHTVPPATTTNGHE